MSKKLEKAKKRFTEGDILVPVPEDQQYESTITIHPGETYTHLIRPTGIFRLDIVEITKPTSLEVKSIVIGRDEQLAPGVPPIPAAIINHQYLRFKVCQRSMDLQIVLHNKSDRDVTTQVIFKGLGYPPEPEPSVN